MHLLIEMVEETKQIGEFSPKGLRVLVVDADPLSLLTLERMLRQCHYNVTTCSRVMEAISLVMENNGYRFDIVITDVYLPDEDGFELLDVVGLTLDIPIILMSSDGETSVVMKAITHGACDYLIKPLTMEVLRNIWQHVIRRRGLRPTQPAPRYLRNDELNGEADDGKVVDSPVSYSKKRKVATDNTSALQDNNFPSVDVGIIDDISSLKKSRVHWTAQLHEKFVRAVNQLEIDKAVPKRILEIMKVQGLTRENVASHLQKYRLYLKRLSGSIPEPYPIASFQAAEGGKSGGTMQICPSRRLKAVPPLSSSSLKGLSSRLELGSREIDAATLKSLQQYRAYQQKLAANRSARVLGTAAAAIPSNVDVSKPTATLNRTSSLDHDSLWKSGRDAGDDQQGLRTNSLEGLADQSLKEAVKLQDLEADRCSPKKLPRAQSMSSSSSQTLLSVQGSVADDDLTKRMEGISCIGTDYEEELFDNLVEECGLSEAQFHFMSAPLLDHILE